MCASVLVEINRMCAGVHGSRWVGGSGATQPCDHVCLDIVVGVGWVVRMTGLGFTSLRWQIS
jgi:hypothetical protein